MAQGDLIRALRNKHDVTCYRFDQSSTPEPIASFAKQVATPAQIAESSTNEPATELRAARVLYGIAAALLVFSLLAPVAHGLLGWRWRGREDEAWWLLASGLSLVVAIVLAAVTHLRHPQLNPSVLLGRAPASATAGPAASAVTAAAAAETEPTVDWAAQLIARGSETRMGDALRWIVDKERGGPLAGVVVITDGRSNGGVDPGLSTLLAEEAEIPVYPVGMGSDRRRRTYAWSTWKSPPRVYPGDGFTITGYLQASGFAGRSVTLDLISTADAPNAAEVSQEQRRLTLPEDGQIVPVKFEVTPDAIGRRQWILRVAAPAEDLEPADNQRTASVEVVERKNHVLLLAGGPQREYHFLRNLLFRDPNTTLDVLLQSAPPGAAQESQEVLQEFPADAESMFDYDCIVAIDPDWRQLSSQQIELLDRWVAEKAGGLIVVAGPVFTPLWSRGASGVGEESKLNPIRSLYPVAFFSRGSPAIQLGRASAEAAWPLQFTAEGRQASFLWLEDSPTASEQAWTSFPGVYGYQAIKDIKPGAKVYARFSDPEVAAAGEAPVYMAGQFYGGGRVFYLGSGEIWRLRGVNERYFDTFYTKLIRDVSQGRLLRDSSRGLLLVDKDRCSLGDSITIRATLADAQYRPLTLPAVTASVVHERGERSSLMLRQITNSEREGMYSGAFTPLREGDYRIDLEIPGVEGELLTREVRVRIPAIEIEQPQRHDALLSQLATQTQGAYFVGWDAALGRDGTAPLTDRIRTKDQETYLPGSPDRDFQQRLNAWLLAIVCGALCLEWLARRLSRLA